MKTYDVIILGGGAAGLMCAFTAGQRGRHVLVLERSNKVGKKILMSGGGRCNFTNLYVTPECYLSANPHFCKSALSRYTQWDFIDLVKKHGISFHEKSQGQLFCDGSSKEILSMLLLECEQAKVDIRANCEVTRIDCNQRFELVCNLGVFKAESLVIATGGLSIPTLGGSDFGYEVAKQFRMRVTTPHAGLVPLIFTDSFQAISSRLSGISIHAGVSTSQHTFVDEVLFTHRGLSGPAILQLSSYWQPGEEVTINLMPDQDACTLLKSFKHNHPRAVLRTLLSQHLPKKLVLEFEQLWWPQWTNIALAEWPDNLLVDIAACITNWVLKPAGTEGYRTAEVTLGGVNTDDLSSKTMEGKTRPGLYFIGEVVDVTGHLGGFNFQWAWSSGYVAGQFV